jgi:hypothetical protein
LVRRIARSPFWLFLVLTLAVTWPLAGRATRSLASDYGDPLFATWLVGWVAGQMTRALQGDLHALRAFWDANIFFPERNTLAFAEHLVGETIQVLPVYWLTGNLLLCYNAAFLLTFVVGAYGMYLLIADLTGSAWAAAAGGVFFAFTEYRLVYEVSHLQTMSNHWLPIALLGLHRFIARDSRRALAGGAAALVLLNLSAGYHMLFDGPFVAAFVAVDLARHGRLRDRRVWIALASAAAAVALLTLPFTYPYIEMQRQLGFERGLDEVIRFSATLDQYRAALPGFLVPLLLASAAIILELRRHSEPAPETWSRRSASMMVAAVGMGALLAFWLSLGPVVRAGGRVLPVPGIYAPLYSYVPGFRGVRAVARMATMFFFFLAMLAGFGVAAIERRSRRAAQATAIVACAVFLWQTTPAPLPLDREWPFVSAGLAPVPAYLRPAPAAPPVYRFVATLDRDAVLVEFPFGDNAYDLRYMYFSAAHRRRMLGGYSGVFPDSWVRRRALLERPFAHDDAAWAALDGATHAVVHTRAWPDATGAQIGAWLRAHGAREAGAFDDAHVFELRR